MKNNAYNETPLIKETTMLSKIKNAAPSKDTMKAIAGGTVVVATVVVVAAISHKIKEAHKSNEK